jgi:hypothetical protein
MPPQGAIIKCFKYHTIARGCQIVEKMAAHKPLYKEVITVMKVAVLHKFVIGVCSMLCQILYFCWLVWSHRHTQLFSVC